MRFLFYLCLFFLLTTAGTSFGWFLACNKPFDPEIITLKGDTVFIAPEPVSVIGLKEFPDKPKKSWGKERTTHKVKKGETVYGIATRTYGIPIPTLMAWNRLQNEQIKAGQVLKIGTLHERDSARQAYKSDSLYTYEKQLSDSSVKISVLTQSKGEVTYQSIKYELLAVKQRNRLFLGVGYDGTVSAMGAYEMKNGWLTTLGYNPTFGSLQFGVLKRIK